MKTRNCLWEEIKHDVLMNEKHKKTCKYLNYVEHLFVLVSAVTGCVSVSAFICVPVVIMS